MSHILLVTSSPRESDSLSTRFATEIADGIQARSGGPLTVRDLAANPPPHITPAYIQGRITSPEDRTPEQGKAVRVAQEFVDLVGRLRYTEASLYTQRDTPMFTCAKAPIDAILAQLANID